MCCTVGCTHTGKDVEHKLHRKPSCTSITFDHFSSSIKTKPMARHQRPCELVLGTSVCHMCLGAVKRPTLLALSQQKPAHVQLNLVTALLRPSEQTNKNTLAHLDRRQSCKHHCTNTNKIFCCMLLVMHSITQLERVSGSCLQEQRKPTAESH